jgi:hypothetical protein
MTDREIIFKEHLNLARKLKCNFTKISAKNNINIGEAFCDIIRFIRNQQQTQMLILVADETTTLKTVTLKMMALEKILIYNAVLGNASFYDFAASRRQRYFDNFFSAILFSFNVISANKKFIYGKFIFQKNGIFTKIAAEFH